MLFFCKIWIIQKYDSKYVSFTKNLAKKSLCSNRADSMFGLNFFSKLYTYYNITWLAK